MAAKNENNFATFWSLMLLDAVVVLSFMGAVFIMVG